MSQVIANGQTIVAKLPCTIEEFLVAQGSSSRTCPQAEAEVICAYDSRGERTR